MARLADLPATLTIVGSALVGLLLRLRPLFITLGIAFALLIILAFTRLPYDAHRALGRAAGECHGTVDLLVVLGGSGMPSGAELRRLHHASELAQAHPSAAVWVIHPGDPAVIDAMVAELELRGVALERIRRLNEGDNTRAQALAVRREVGEAPLRIALVSAPENMYRSVKAFHKVGLRQVCGAPAWDHAMDHDFAYRHKRIGGKAYVPDVSTATDLRYTFWNYLKLEVTCLREYVAIAYYALNGWI
ncbi:MAG: YdcF family protein [Flavobacteriales bacterium]